MTADPIRKVPADEGLVQTRYTEREFTILCLVAEGLTNVETAARLHISRHTVAQHVAEMLRTAGARSRAELVARAYCGGVLRTGIWPPQPEAGRTHLAAVRG